MSRHSHRRLDAEGLADSTGPNGATSLAVAPAKCCARTSAGKPRPNTANSIAGKRTCNVGKFLRTLTKPEPIENWPLTNLKEKLVKIGVELVIHDCHTTLHIASRRRSMQSTTLVRALADLPRLAERQIIDTRKPVIRRILIKSTRLRENCNGKPSSNSGGGNFRLWVIIRCRCRISAERPSRV